MPALVTTPPVPIDPLHCSSQFGVQVNPFGYFKDGSNLYQVLQWTYHTSGDNFIAVYKSTNNGVTWVEQDTANEIDLASNVSGLSACFDPIGRKIYILYQGPVAPGFGYQVIAFDVSTDTYGTPSAATGSMVHSTQPAAIYMQSGGTLVVVSCVGVGGGAALNYLTLIAGVWSGPTALGSVADPYILGVDVDSSDRGHLVYTDNATATLSYALISPSFSLGTPVTLSPSGSYDFLFIDHRIWNNKIVYIWGESTVLKVAIGTPLSAPVFTTYTVQTVVAPQFVWNPTLAEDNTGKLVLFSNTLDSAGAIQDLNMWTFDGVSSFGSPTLFYDSIANPPGNNSTNPISQGTVTGTAIQFASGDWAFSTAMATKGPLNNSSALTGFTLLTRACAGGGSGNLYFAH